MPGLIAHNARPDLPGHGHRVLVGSYGQGHLVTGGLEGAGEVHDALGLVIYLPGDEKHTHGYPPRNNVAAGATSVVYHTFQEMASCPELAFPYSTPSPSIAISVRLTKGME